jgi:hypothetical protein
MIASLLAVPLAAQETEAPWRLSYFPYLTASPNDGVMGIARAIWFRQASWGDRVTLNNSVAVEAGYSTKDAWLGRITWANPRLAEGWRLVAHAEVGHEPRFGDPDAPIERDRALGWVDVTRRLKGPLHFAVRGGIRREEFATNGTSQEDTDATFRGALVLDLRDREFEVNRGALLEGGMIFGNGDRNAYSAAYTHLRGWYNPLQYLRVTGRFAWRQPVEDGSLASGIELPGWEGDFVAVGGHRSHRGLGTGQLRRDGFMIAGAEARFDVFNVGELGALSLLAFADGGRVLRHLNDFSFCDPSPCAPDPTLDWRWGGGGGVALRVLRAATLTITASGGDGETRWYVGSGWSW